MRRRPGRRAIGVTTEAIDEDTAAARLDALGDDGTVALRLDGAVADLMGHLDALSPLTSPLALDYLERIRRPIPALSLAAGVFVTTRGYVAHLAVEADPAAYGAADIPVLGTLPPLRNRRPPGDLANRVVRATRRGFEGIRAVNTGVWDGYVITTARRAHERDPGDGIGAGSDTDTDIDLATETAAGWQPLHLDSLVIDGLVRFGWVLRQADLHYGLEPEEA